jgi:hypothetical protein
MRPFRAGAPPILDPERIAALRVWSDATEP